MISSALLKCRNRNVKRVSRKIVASLTSQWWGWWWWWWGWKWWWWWRWHVKYDSCWYPTVVNISPPHMQMFTEAIKICNEPLQKFCSNTTVRSSSSSPPSSSSSSLGWCLWEWKRIVCRFFPGLASSSTAPTQSTSATEGTGRLGWKHRFLI